MNKDINERFFGYWVLLAILKRKEKGHIKNVTGKTKKMGLTLVGMSSENKKMLIFSDT